PRVDEMMRRVLAELRLVFHVMGDPERFHAPYLDRNHEIAGLLERGEGAAAEQALLTYLDDAEAQLLNAYAEGLTPLGGPAIASG
ncbi:MAG: GntR family transcriptional regulator, partial [Acidimicrobiales bacterium]